MSDGATLPPGPRATTLTADETRELWDAYREGGPVRCPRDTGGLALSVDSSNSYRLVCTRCGNASSWFEAAPAGIQMRSAPPPPDDGPDAD